ncbi:hypothetical protein NLJ89_g1886 [Agrocybe chaxingu]|uniref:Transglutaminase-like domain-containing protein n=1 Tax=Agrocybe chaxingu TaxID=84603 RepID=A0A9W8MZ70_9AGAR|nr:hypothetical protein NLJ89_g1886 [Agrocybe chaxingu]
MGMQAHLVSGHGKGYGYQALREGEPVPDYSAGHAWNCVQINGEWHLIDSCWGSGVASAAGYEPKLSNKWFISSSIDFGKSHFPEDRSFQLTPEEVTWEEYITAPEGPTITGDFEDFALHPGRIYPATKSVPEKQRIKFSVSKRCEHLSIAEADNYVFVISTTDKEFTPLTFSEGEGAWAVTIFTPRSGDITLYAVTTVSNQDARGLGVAGYAKARGRKAMAFKGLAKWTIAYL